VPSPASAVNLGLRAARADLVGVLIDGARMASPGLCRLAYMASRLHHRPIIATLGFHLGPDVQMRSIKAGYNQEVEDRLLESVDWRANGYELFTISAFAGSSRNGWFGPIAESNALFMPAALWAELGGYDEAFTSPGGGLVNLDTYKRACELPDSELIILLGEGTFHQVHGGIATNSQAAEPPGKQFRQEYRRIRGERFRMPQRQPLLLGSLPPQVHPSLIQSAKLLAEKGQRPQEAQRPLRGPKWLHRLFRSGARAGSAG